MEKRKTMQSFSSSSWFFLLFSFAFLLISCRMYQPWRKARREYPKSTCKSPPPPSFSSPPSSPIIFFPLLSWTNYMQLNRREMKKKKKKKHNCFQKYHIFLHFFPISCYYALPPLSTCSPITFSLPSVPFPPASSRRRCKDRLSASLSFFCVSIFSLR